jgi:hypothetical protein
MEWEIHPWMQMAIYYSFIKLGLDKSRRFKPERKLSPRKRTDSFGLALFDLGLWLSFLSNYAEKGKIRHLHASRRKLRSDFAL